MRNSFLLFLSVGFLPACTISLTNVMTNGSASDVVDDTQTTSPDVKPDVSVSILPKTKTKA